jgi:hypothetical protein
MKSKQIAAPMINIFGDKSLNTNIAIPIRPDAKEYRFATKV